MKTSHPTKKKQQSIWLMLGGAVALSLGGWAAIISQSPDTLANAAIPAVVELPPDTTTANTRSHNGRAQAVPNTNQVQQSTAQSSNTPLRRVRPMMRSRSSN